MESVHGLDGRLGAGGVVEADEAEALALVGGAVDEHLGADHVAEREEHLHQLGVAKLLGGELVSFYSSKNVINLEQVDGSNDDNDEDEEGEDDDNDEDDLGQVVDEEIAPFWSADRAACK